MLGKETNENQDTVMRHQSSQKDLLFKHHFQEGLRISLEYIRKFHLLYLHIILAGAEGCWETWFRGAGDLLQGVGDWEWIAKGLKAGSQGLKKAQCCTKSFYFNPKTNFLT